MPEATKSMTASFFKAIQLDESNSSLESELRTRCGIDIQACLECGKCSGGCSNREIFDYTPRKIVKMIKLGFEDKLYHMDALWTCVGCHICSDRCPAGIDIERIMDYLREKACNKGIEPTRKNVKLFQELMLDSIRKTGKVSEVNLMLKFNLQTGNYVQDADLGRKMFFKGKLKFLTSKVRNIGQINKIFTPVQCKERDR